MVIDQLRLLSGNELYSNTDRNQKLIRKYYDIQTSHVPIGERHNNALSLSVYGVMLNYPEEEVKEHCREFWAKTGEFPDERSIDEIWDSAVRKVEKWREEDKSFNNSTEWTDTEASEEMINQIVISFGGLQDLEDECPKEWKEKIKGMEPYDYIKKLFRKETLLCVGEYKNPNIIEVCPENSEALNRSRFVTPQEIKKDWVIKKGYKSPRNDGNVKSRKHLIVEADPPKPKTAAELKKALDKQAAVILHLMDFMHLSLVVFSGSKSLHSWWDIEGEDEERWRKFFDYSCLFGADKSMKTLSQMCRMPAYKNGSAIQPVHYFNPPELGQQKQFKDIPTITIIDEEERTNGEDN